MYIYTYVYTRALALIRVRASFFGGRIADGVAESAKISGKKCERYVLVLAPPRTVVDRCSSIEAPCFACILRGVPRRLSELRAAKTCRRRRLLWGTFLTLATARH